MSLNEYVLNESIVPIQTKFGTNQSKDNGQFKKFDDFVVSFFENNDVYYVVGLDTTNGMVGFGASNENTTDTDEYGDSKFVTSNPIAVFGKVFYVLTQIVKHTNTDLVKFDSANASLGKVYDKLVKNTYFVKSLAQLGFDYAGNVNGYYTFVKTTANN
jgi:hypothetical protein